MSPIQGASQDARKQAVFHELRATAQKDVEMEHTQWLARVKGSAANLLNARLDRSTTGDMGEFGRLAASVLSWSFQLPGLVGSALNLAITKVTDRAIKGEMEATARTYDIPSRKQAHIRAAGEHLQRTGAAALHDAIRKVADAESSIPTRATDCKGLATMLHARAYYAYRIDRLDAYVTIMRRYVDLVEEQLEAHRVKWAENEKEMESAVPKFFDDPRAHAARCRGSGICFYPWDTIEISSPQEGSGPHHGPPRRPLPERPGLPHLGGPKPPVPPTSAKPSTAGPKPPVLPKPGLPTPGGGKGPPLPPKPTTRR